MRIFLAEDEAAIAGFLKEGLEEEGFSPKHRLSKSIVRGPRTLRIQTNEFYFDWNI